MLTNLSVKNFVYVKASMQSGAEGPGPPLIVNLHLCPLGFVIFASSNIFQTLSQNEIALHHLIRPPNLNFVAVSCFRIVN